MRRIGVVTIIAALCTSLFIGAAGVALGASVSIGLISVTWGKGKAPTTTTIRKQDVELEKF